MWLSSKYCSFHHAAGKCGRNTNCKLREPRVVKRVRETTSAEGNGNQGRKPAAKDELSSLSLKGWEGGSTITEGNGYQGRKPAVKNFSQFSLPFPSLIVVDEMNDCE